MADDEGDMPGNDSLIILLPLLIVLSTLLLLLLLFIACILILRRRRSIVLRDSDGPIDLSREEFISGDGGFEGVESRWLENANELEQAMYRRAKVYQSQYPPNSLPTDITLSQFLSIQEKGVSAWSFDPDYESSPSVLVHARTEITFLPDPSSASSVQSNLPLPKLNEVYYWEVKMFDLPQTTNVSIGLATKPYPSFLLPGHGRYSIAYHSSGDKSFNYPFTSMSFGAPLKEGDVLGVGYRPRTGTVFFTRNGRKTEDAFVGLSRFNLFPTVGADGPCSLHVNLGQAGFVHIEANVKKWGLAPSVGTLAPPPAYGSERGSILLEAGGTPSTRPGSRSSIGGAVDGARSPLGPPPPADLPSTSSTPSRRTARNKRGKPSNVPVHPSPLRGTSTPPNETGRNGAEAQSERTPLLATEDDRIDEEDEADVAAESDDGSSHSSGEVSSQDGASRSAGQTPMVRITTDLDTVSGSGNQRGETVDDEDDDEGSPTMPHNPPTPHVSDIHLRPLGSSHSRSSSVDSPSRPAPRVELPSSSRRRHNRPSGSSSHSRSLSQPNPLPPHLRPPTDSDPPAYSPLDAYVYPNGVSLDLPADVIAAALEGPTSAQRSAAAAVAARMFNAQSSATDAQRAAARAAFEGAQSNVSRR